MERQLCKFNGRGAMRKALKRGESAGEIEGRIDLVGVSARWKQDFASRLETKNARKDKKGARQLQLARGHE